LRRLGLALVLLLTAGSVTAGVLAFTQDGDQSNGEVTEPPPPPPRAGGRVAVVAAAGDIACDEDEEATEEECEQGSTAELLDQIRPDAVLPLGDLQYEDAELSDFEASYDKTWGRYKNITRPAPGNHEYKTDGAEGYFDYFGDAAGDRDKGYYSFDLGKWHLIALNSNCEDRGDCEAGSEQERWLRDDLAASKAKCTLAYWHHPRFSSGRHGSYGELGPIWEALHDAGAEIVLSGHDHSYERFAPQTPSAAPDDARGIREFVVGTGGKSFYDFETTLPNSEVQNNDTNGVLKLTLRPQGYDWEFVPEEGASFRDSGSGRCH
jgi:hypothetical protein